MSQRIRAKVKLIDMGDRRCSQNDQVVFHFHSMEAEPVGASAQRVNKLCTEIQRICTLHPSLGLPAVLLLQDVLDKLKQQTKHKESALPPALQRAPSLPNTREITQMPVKLKPLPDRPPSSKGTDVRQRLGQKSAIVPTFRDILRAVGCSTASRSEVEAGGKGGAS